MALGLTALGTVGCGSSPEPAKPLPPGTEVTVRNHRELTVLDDAVIPRFLGGRDPGLCLQVGEGVDASQWRALLTFEGIRDRDAEETGEPVARSGDVLCFERSWPEGLESPADLRLCGTLVDLYDGSRFDVPCQTLRLEPDDGARAALMEEVNTAVAERRNGYFGEFLDRLVDVAHRARAQGFPALNLRVDLIAVHYILQEGELETLPRAERLLRTLPPWIDRPAATALAADTAYLAGVLRYQRRDELERAWQELLRAEALYRRILDKKRLAPVRGQAEILARVGAVREALLRLERGLQDCADASELSATGPASTQLASSPSGAPCSDVQRADARGLHAWLTLIDSDASPAELHTAAEHLEKLQEQASLEPQERANHLVNLALLRARQGHSPSEALSRAADLAALDTTGGASVRAELLVGWSRMAEAVYELSRPDGDLRRAEQRCRELTRGTPSPRLDAWAFSCLGRLYRRQGSLEAATRAFDQALSLHDEVPSLDLGRLLPLGPGERADDHYRAARVALELEDGARAWRILTSLDRSPGPAGVESSQTAPEHPGYRAFALDDEIFLLRRPAAAPAVLVRRTKLANGDLRQRTDAIQQALDRRQLPDDAWRELLAPLAEALWPADAGRSSGQGPIPVTTYALHGLLQRVPLAALPGDAAGAGDADATEPGSRAVDAGRPRWLADVTVPAVWPAGSPLPSTVPPVPVPAGDRAPVVVLDPLENLGARQQQAKLYAEVFPEGRVLVGREATLAAFRTHLPAASWLHVDTHGTYDPAFPERSRLDLADGAITLEELARLPTALSFANLSGCQTGRWPVTADSGRYGIGGLLAQRGSGWVIASRADLLDHVARAFNLFFYEALGRGAGAPEAYRQALDVIRARTPAATWASLFLLHGTGAGSEDREGSDRQGGNSPR